MRVDDKCPAALTPDGGLRLLSRAFSMELPVGVSRGMQVVLLATVAACASAGTPTGRTAVDVRGLSVPDAVSVAAREQTADQQVVHALNRLAFGPRPGDAQAVRELGVDRWIAAQPYSCSWSQPSAC